MVLTLCCEIRIALLKITDVFIKARPHLMKSVLQTFFGFAIKIYINNSVCLILHKKVQ